MATSTFETAAQQRARLAKYWQADQAERDAWQAKLQSDLQAQAAEATAIGEDLPPADRALKNATMDKIARVKAKTLANPHAQNLDVD
jgi:hypothetical protein